MSVEIDIDEVRDTLMVLLDTLMEAGNQEGSFTVTDVNLDTMKFSVEFDIVMVEEDGYVGFAGY